MNPTSFFEFNESNSLAQGSDWHTETFPDRDYLSRKLASSQALFELDSIGSFEFTDAVRPGKDASLALQQGYRRETFRSRSRNMEMPMILAAATCDVLFDLFLELLDPLGTLVDCVLETSHSHGDGSHEDLYREKIDLPVLKSTLCDYESLILNDGCTGVAVVNAKKQLEVQLDEHKMLMIYAEDLNPFERILFSYDVWPMENMRFITEEDHVHSSRLLHRKQFDQLSFRLGMDI
ncbi:MAG: hypothetical protein VX776_05435 [Planctomycetota bacterium]|nr:hypothetical protein [Planctomycetota bacterium]